LESNEPKCSIRQAVAEDLSYRRLDVEYLERFLRSCQGLRSLTLELKNGGLPDLSVLQDLPCELSLWITNEISLTLNQRLLDFRLGGSFSLRWKLSGSIQLQTSRAHVSKHRPVYYRSHSHFTRPSGSTFLTITRNVTNLFRQPNRIPQPVSARSTRTATRSAISALSHHSGETRLFHSRTLALFSNSTLLLPPSGSTYCKWLNTFVYTNTST